MRQVEKLQTSCTVLRQVVNVQSFILDAFEAEAVEEVWGVLPEQALDAMAMQALAESHDARTYTRFRKLFNHRQVHYSVGIGHPIPTIRDRH